ncbi:MAG TPA: peptidoglycan recognition family protein [Planctomycetota bacterium]|nr:peptidoglycan recognition family protein [Planctomycetota bacterium]
MNHSWASRLWKFSLPIVALLLLFTPGCGHDHCNSCNKCTTCVSDSSSYQAYDSTAYAPMNPPIVTQPSVVTPPPVVYNNTQPLPGTRSKAELDAMFNAARLQPLPPLVRPVTPGNLPPPGNVVIVAPNDPQWNVPISRQWTHIVIHHSASTTGSAASFDRAHREKGWDGLGYHFVIGNGSGSGDGQVEVGYRWTKQLQGAHAGNYEYNQHGIGICLVGDFEKVGPPSAAQMASLRSLVAFLQARCSIPTNEIIGHGNVPGRNTECPGRYLDVARFRASLNSAYVVPSGAKPLIENEKKPLIKATASVDATENKASVLKAVLKP